MNIEKILPRTQENVLLRDYTTFKIGGRAKYFFVAKNKEDLIKAVKTARKNNLPFFILGEGSNVLFSDEEYKGLVVRCQLSNVNCRENGNIYVEAGVELDKLVKLATKKSLTGLEWAAGIPGTIGGAIYGNAQAFGVRISDIIQGVEALDLEKLKVRNLSQKQCRFSIKNSIFKKNKDLIIVSAILKLKKGNKKEIQRKTKENLNYRRKRHPLNLPSAGSVFINSEKIKVKDQRLLKKFPELKEFNKKGLIPSAYLIEKCGLKGKKIGRAQISEKHANFIINLGRAKSEDVLKLIKLAKQKVKSKFGINLKEEIQIK